jgi:hypothetical protein
MHLYKTDVLCTAGNIERCLVSNLMAVCFVTDFPWVHSLLYGRDAYFDTTTSRYENCNLAHYFSCLVLIMEKHIKNGGRKIIHNVIELCEEENKFEELAVALRHLFNVLQHRQWKLLRNITRKVSKVTYECKSKSDGNFKKKAHVL